ncbi:unnamed protein product [Angiostrongylus costaricensis]|uniref:Metalloprotease n=1 Tax=Angiostrongylus costaricensis TaxID=334426 RepID=A0A0R3PG92_ANGCS|nr:unnamed protein product [Angiostrongylus costaricensis]
MKTILVLTTLAAIAHGKTYTMETHSSGSLISRLIKEKQYQKYLEERNLHRSQVLVKGSQPVVDFFDAYYLVNITVGTPVPEETDLIPRRRPHFLRKTARSLLDTILDRAMDASQRTPSLLQVFVVNIFGSI